ncbi:MAG: XdhC/CoxI family protein [Candidatus Krumholzibacteriia bacterium]
MLDIYTEIETLNRQGRPAVVVTVVARHGHVPTEVQAKMLVDAAGRVAGTVGGGAIEKHALADARAVLERRQPLLKEYLLDDHTPGPDDPAEPTGMICGGRVTLFFEVLGAGERAYLFGGGHVNRALHLYLAPLGFEVVFVDYRADQLADLPARHLVAGPDYATIPTPDDLVASFVVIATHSHVCDERVLAQILATGARPRYLGVVASRRKRVQMYAGLRERLGRDLDLEWIHMPVGLHLGGNTPAAVALSIAAEMQACRHGVGGHLHLRDRPAPAAGVEP